MGRSATEVGTLSRVRVFERRSAPEPPIQMYSAWTIEAGRAISTEDKRGEGGEEESEV